MLFRSTHIMRQCNSYYDNIDTPTDTMQTACNQLNTTERVKLAYNWCSELHENEEQYRERIIRETGDSTHVDRKIAMMKQACNSVFCNENDTALGYITEEQICFPPPPDIDPATGDIIEEEELPDPEPPNTNEAQNFVKTTLKWFIFIIIIPALLLIFWFLYKNYVYPKAIKPVWLAIERLLGKDPEVQAFEQAAFKQIGRAHV